MHLVPKVKLNPYSYKYDKYMHIFNTLLYWYFPVKKPSSGCVCVCAYALLFFPVCSSDRTSLFLPCSPSTRRWHTVYMLWVSAVLSGLSDATFPFNQYVSMWQLDTHLEHCTPLTLRLESLSYEIKAGEKQTLDFLRSSKKPQTFVAEKEISHHMNVRDCSGQPILQPYQWLHISNKSRCHTDLCEKLNGTLSQNLALTLEKVTL